MCVYLEEGSLANYGQRSHEDGALIQHNRWPYKKRKRGMEKEERDFSLFPYAHRKKSHMRTQQKGSHVQHELSPETESVVTLIWDSSLGNCEKANICGILLGSLNRQIHSPNHIFLICETKNLEEINHFKDIGENASFLQNVNRYATKMNSVVKRDCKILNVLFLSWSSWAYTRLYNKSYKRNKNQKEAKTKTLWTLFKPILFNLTV